MSVRRGVRFLLVLLVALVFQGPTVARARQTMRQDDEICDPLADYFLGMEDYPEAVQRHLMVVREHPDNAVAHYHLGFAYGITGHHGLELKEYREAIALGLGDWELFLNMGLLYLETDNLSEATEVLSLATLLAPFRPETHFNLGLAYARRGMLPWAEQEMLQALGLDPDEADTRNSLGVIYAEEGKYDLAREQWSGVLETNPDYGPARTNLVILEQMRKTDMKAWPRRVSGALQAP